LYAAKARLARKDWEVLDKSFFMPLFRTKNEALSLFRNL
jgi:hypothetical protein